MNFSPRQLNRRADLYRQLGQMLESGIPILQALDVLRRFRGPSVLQRGIEILRTRIQSGDSLTKALSKAGIDIFPAFDTALLQAGEASGRLAQSFSKLAGYYEERGRLLRQMILWTAYPLLILHVAFLIFPISVLQGIVQGKVAEFLLNKLFIFIPFYFLLFCIAFLMQSNRALWIKGLLERILLIVPVIRGAVQSMAMSRLCLALEGLLSSGTPVIESWELAGVASGSFVLARASERMRPALDRNKTPAEVVVASPEFPQEFAQQYYAGEISGKLDETLKRMQVFYEEQGIRRSRTAVIMVAGGIYGTVLLYGAYQVIRFYMSYFGQILGGV